MRQMSTGTSQPWTAHPLTKECALSQPVHMCRSVQTALSYAESIGYSTEFVLPPDQPAAAEAQRQRQFHPVPDGIILASVVCLGIVVLLFAACASYFILTVVA